MLTKEKEKQLLYSRENNRNTKKTAREGDEKRQKTNRKKNERDNNKLRYIIR